MELVKKVGENIKLARKAMGLTQKEVAARLHMTQQQYSRFENGIFELNYQQLVTLCKMFETTPNEIFDFEP